MTSDEGQVDDHAKWDERYGKPGFAYGTVPNRFLTSVAGRIPVGRVLSLGEGEGRNAVYLATCGHDVVAVDGSRVGVIGGGPAGSTCAWKLGQAGVDLVVLDRARFPRTKLCAGWITPEVVSDLELDLSSYPHSSMSFDKLHFHLRNWKFAKKTTQHSIRRYEFDDYLLQRSGATVHEHTVRKIENLYFAL